MAERWDEQASSTGQESSGNVKGWILCAEVHNPGFTMRQPSKSPREISEGSEKEHLARSRQDPDKCEIENGDPCFNGELEFPLKQLLSQLGQRSTLLAGRILDSDTYIDILFTVNCLLLNSFF